MSATSPTSRNRTRAKPRWLLAVCVILAGVGLACGHGPYGITFVGADADETLIAQGRFSQSGEWNAYTSADGGLSWTHVAMYDGTNHPQWRDHGKLAAKAPRGQYQISGDGNRITRANGNGTETVYSVNETLDGANMTLAHRNRKSVGSQLHSIHYDAPSGNVIAAVETDGVVVETPDGRWSRVAVGPYAPTHYPSTSRLMLLLSSPTLWLSILAVLTAFAAAAFVLVAGRWPEIALATAVFAVTGTAYFLTYRMSVDNLLPLFLIVAAWPVIMAALYLLLALCPGERLAHRGSALTGMGFILAGAIFGFPGLHGSPGSSALLIVWDLPQLYLPMIAAALGLAIMATRPYLPVGEDWHKAGMAAAITMLLALLAPVVLWLLYVLTQEAAQAISIGLAGAVALAWFAHLKRRQRRRTLGGWY